MNPFRFHGESGALFGVFHAADPAARAGCAVLLCNPFGQEAVRSQRVLEEDRAAPDTRLGSPTWGWIARSCDAAHAARSDAAQVTTPVLVLVAGQDKIVLNHGAVQFCRRLVAARPGAGCGGPEGGPVVVAGAEHEMLIERDALRQQAMGRALAFLQQAGR